MERQNTLFDEVSAGSYIGGSTAPISARTLQRWRLEGVGPVYVKLGRLVRYRQTDLDAFIEECARVSTSVERQVRASAPMGVTCAPFPPPV